MTLPHIILLLVLVAVILVIAIFIVKKGMDVIMDVIINIFLTLIFIFVGSIILDMLLGWTGHEQVVLDWVLEAFKFIGESIADIFN